MSSKLFSKKHHIIILSFVLIFLAFLPLMIKAPELAGSDVGIPEAGGPTEVNSFFSVSDDIIFFISSEKNLLTPEFKVWVDFFAFEIESNSTIGQYIRRPANARNLFTEASLVLKNHLLGLQRAIVGYNISYSVVTEYSFDLLNNFSKIAITSGMSIANSTLLNNIYNTTSLYLKRLPYAIYFLDEVIDWGKQVIQFASKLYSGQSLNELIADINTAFDADFDKILSSIFSDRIKNFVRSVFNRFGIGYTGDIDIYPFIAEQLIDQPTAEDVSFFRELYASGNPIVPILLARDQLINFLKGDFLPPTFDPAILNFLRSSYSNYNEGVLTSFIITIPITPNLNASEIMDFFTNIVVIRDKYETISPTKIRINILNQGFYNVERNNTFLSNFIFLDYLSVILAFSVLYFFFRSLRIALFPVLVAWPTTYFSRLLVVLLLRPFNFVNSGSLSVSSALIFGASLNYTVFFLVRYLEEYNSSHDIEKALAVSKKFALHSIHISGVAVVLTSLPLVASTVDVISYLSMNSIIGISIQLVLLSLLLPSIFTLSGNFIKNATLKKHIIRLRKVNRKNSYQILFVFFLLFTLSLSFLIIQPGEITGNDLIGGNGEAVQAYRVLDKNYPKTFLAKVLVSIDISEKLRDDNRNLILTNSEVVIALYGSLSPIQGVSTVYSYMSPLGKLIDYSNNSFSLTESMTISSVAEQFVNEFGNTTFMMLQLSTGKTMELVEIVKSIENTIHNTLSSFSEASNVKMYGLPVEILVEVEKLIESIPVLITISIVFLTIFLWTRFYSIAIPLRLILSIVVGGILSMAFGMAVWIIVFGRPMSLFVISLILIFLLALGTDFDIYLYNRIIEEYQKTRELDVAINNAVTSSAIGIELSGMAMAMSFAVLLFSDTSLFVQFGFVITLAILLDITVIRQWLVPALLLVFPESTVRGLEKHTNKKG